MLDIETLFNGSFPVLTTEALLDNPNLLVAPNTHIPYRSNSIVEKYKALGCNPFNVRSPPNQRSLNAVHWQEGFGDLDWSLFRFVVVQGHFPVQLQLF